MTDLSAPLTRHGAKKAKAGGFRSIHIPVTRIALGLIVLIGAAVGARLVLVDDPTGGRPSASTEITGAAGGNAVAGAVAGGVTITADPEMIPLDEVPALGSAESSFAVIDAAAIDPELVEQTEFGPIPRMSGTGLRPFDMYARPAPSTSGRPRIAIVVSGLGLNTESTQQAITSLPEDITLAFAPYGRTLDKTVTTARSEGHEIFLEVPLEPFDYPDNDPGPDTLLTGQPPRDNMSRLFKVMSSFEGYAGIINNMGARFTASGADFGPVMEELGARGLGYLDDGSSNRSLSPQLARANRVPFARIAVPVDANPSRAAIDKALAELERQAQSGNGAIGIISALPVSIEAVSEWAAALSDRGIDLVPASALMGEQ
ncbi:MAG: divergent polysaccharide deacetylase family protein [Devosia sp.]